MKKLLTALALVAALGTFTGIVLKFNNTFARDNEVVALSKKVDAHKLEHRLEDVEARMWCLEKQYTAAFVQRFGRYPTTIAELIASMPEESQEEYHRLQKEKAELEAKIKKLRGE